jgi:hypothetical protein
MENGELIKGPQIAPRVLQIAGGFSWATDYTDYGFACFAGCADLREMAARLTEREECNSR